MKRMLTVHFQILSCNYVNSNINGDERNEIKIFKFYIFQSLLIAPWNKMENSSLIIKTIFSSSSDISKKSYKALLTQRNQIL